MQQIVGCSYLSLVLTTYVSLYHNPRQQHNTLIYYLTSSHNPNLPTYYLHDPTDLSPPIVLSSSNPKWVERQALIYARGRIQICCSAVVGIYLEYSNTLHMIGMYHLGTYLFLSLPYRIPLSLTTTFYSSIQTDNSLRRADTLRSIVVGTDLLSRNSDLLQRLEHTLSICRYENPFFADYSDDQRQHYLYELTTCVTLLGGYLRMTRERE